MLILESRTARVAGSVIEAFRSSMSAIDFSFRVTAMQQPYKDVDFVILYHIMSSRYWKTSG
jgi:hypothetical protein